MSREFEELSSLSDDDQPSAIVQRNKWVCDKCRVATFEEYDDACRHEEICTGAPPAAPASVAAKASRSAFAPPRKKQWVCDFCKVASFYTFDEACRHEEICPAAPNSSASAAKRSYKRTRCSNFIAKSSTSTSAAPSAHVIQKLQGTGLGQIRSCIDKRETSNCIRSDTIDLTSPSCFSTEHPPPMSSGKKRKTDEEVALANPNPKSLAAIFTSPRPVKKTTSKTEKVKEPSPGTALVNEHRAAENAANFLRKRKKKLEEARRKAVASNRATEEAAVAGIFTSRSNRELEGSEASNFTHVEQSMASADAKSTSVALKPSLPTKRRSSYPAAPHFPVPTHVVSTNGGANSSFANVEVVDDNLVSRELILSSIQHLVNAPRFPGATLSSETKKVTEVEATPSFLCMNEKFNPRLRGATSDISQAFASILQVPPITLDGDYEYKDTNLWSARYGMQSLPEDVCGENNKDAAGSIMSFIKEWKGHRAEFVKKLEEKRRSLSKLKRKKKKNSYYADDLWDDEEDLGLCNIFMLTGPHGTGKSALVHAAAVQSGCVLVEINTSERRGGAALKRAIEECTQSHSSLALLKRGGGGSRMSGCPEDEDPRDSADSTDESDNSGATNERGRLAAILIDEVDNIFESDGDAGFWPALANLAKKAKCPIILTSCTFPAVLDTSNIRYQHASMSRPKPLECASLIWEIANAENMFRSKEGTAGKEEENRRRLCRIAELCGCDLRRIINEMQLYSHHVSKEANMSSALSCDTWERTSGEVSDELDAPTISNIFPKSSQSDQYSVVTIMGNHFINDTDRVCTEVTIGGQPCPVVRVVSKNIMLVVCPPCVLPSGVDASGVFEDKFEDCITCRYASVNIKMTIHESLVLRSDMSCNIEYLFPDKYEWRAKREHQRMQNQESNRHEEDFSSDDDDFVVRPTRRKVVEKEKEKSAEQEIANVVSMTSDMTSETGEDAVPDSPCQSIMSIAEAEALVDIEMKNSKLSKVSAPLSKRMALNDARSSSKFEEVVKSLEYISDAAYLDHAFSSLATPSLSGAVRGFGSEMVDNQNLTSDLAAMKRRKASSKPPTIEKLYSSGWTDSAFFFGSSNSYVTLPSLHDRLKLSTANSFPAEATTSCAITEGEEKSLSSAGISMLISGSPIAPPSDDGTFFQVSRSSPVHSISKVLQGAAAIPCSEDNGLLLTRRNERGSSSAAALLALLDDRVGLCSSCLGLGDTGKPTPSDTEVKLDNRFTLDYLPSLRAMAAAEHSAENAFMELLQQHPDLLGHSSRRSTRRRGSKERQNYFASFDGRYAEGNPLAKKTCAELATMGFALQT